MDIACSGMVVELAMAVWGSGCGLLFICGEICNGGTMVASGGGGSQ
jgi:hypothetical protein